MNNTRSSSTGKTPNETVYGVSPNVASTLSVASDANLTLPMPSALIGVADAIAYANMDAKHHYDRKHQPMAIKAGEYALLRLHRGYFKLAGINARLFGHSDASVMVFR